MYGRPEGSIFIVAVFGYLMPILIACLAVYFGCRAVNRESLTSAAIGSVLGLYVVLRMLGLVGPF